MDRRQFIDKSKTLAVGAASLSILPGCTSKASNQSPSEIIITTWNNMEAIQQTQAALNQGSSVLDAVISGINVAENNPKDRSVGLGGRPDSDGTVTLDAGIMNHQGDYGAVTYLQDYQNPINIAKAVMEHSPHAILSGAGAWQFAESQGFARSVLLTEESKKDYEKWVQESAIYQPKANIEKHDTIGLLAMDDQGQMAAGCSTSGMAYKHPGRVGDSPIIGSGLYLDSSVGMATATGLGEEILKVVGSFLIVELMRAGQSPQAACEVAVQRVHDRNPDSEVQVAFIAMHKSGQIGAYSLMPGFSYAIYQNGSFSLHDSASLL